MEQIPTEDLKLLAEAIYDDDDITVDGNRILIEVRSRDRWKVIEWNPANSADQCSMVLEWFKIETGRDWDTDEWVAGIRVADQYFEFGIHKDFKTAVTLAAIEYCKQ